MNLRKVALIASLLSVPLALRAETPAPASPPAPAGTESDDVASQQQELAGIIEQISTIQHEAEKSEEVQSAKNAYREALKKEMVRQAPEMEKDINRQIELVDALMSSPGTDESGKPTEERAQQIAEYQQLRQKLVPIEKSAGENEEVRKARQAYSVTLVTEMKRIEPKTEELINRQREIMASLRQRASQAPSG